MPLNPKGTMFPFNGDISGVVAAAGRCWGGGLPGSSVAACSSFSGPSLPLPASPRFPLLCSWQVSISLI